MGVSTCTCQLSMSRNHRAKLRRQGSRALHIWCFVRAHCARGSMCAHTCYRATREDDTHRDFHECIEGRMGGCKLTPTWPHDLQMSHQSMTSFQSGVLDAPPVRVMQIACVRLSR